MATGCGTVQAKESEPPYRHRPLVRMKDLPAAGRPRERMLDRGAACLTEADLVAVLLGTGDAKRSAVGLAQELLARFAESDDPTGLRGLLHAGPDALMEVPGMGEAKSARVIAALELGRRLAMAGPAERPTINGPDDAWRLLAPTLATLDREHFVALLVNSKHQVIGQVVVAIGTLNATLVHPRELFKEAIRKSAMGVLLAHNHPSGDPTPSPEDRALTHQLMAAGEILGMKVLDHLIIGDGRYVSLRQASPLWTEQPFHQ
jgi:DNA repair protein RadC